MRRNVGASHVLNKQNRAQKFNQMGNKMAEDRYETTRKHFMEFKEKLSEFASKHRQRINKDPEFRQKFHEMCTSLDVDPLVTHTGIWSTYLDIGEFYNNLGVQILTICLATRHSNGGVLDIRELLLRLARNSGKTISSNNITESDIFRAIKHLDTLGEKGITTIRDTKHTLIISLPEAFGMDQLACLNDAQETGYFSLKLMQDNQKWTESRFNDCIKTLISEGVVWVDTSYENNQIKTLYWVPSIFFRIQMENQGE